LRYAPAQAPVEIRFADGTTWDQAAIFDKLYVRRGTAGSDTLTAGLGDFQLFGYAGNDTLNGGAGNDLLDGGTGADSIIGGGGNDTCIVDDAGDVVVESLPGYDTIKTSISYVLPANVESLVLVGASAINGTGNNLVNKIAGNACNNVLDGKAGADTLQGGAGDDTYIVDNAGDAVIENVGEGVDLIQSSITYSLGINVENLLLAGSAAINGTGNAGDNAITGNAGVNTLTGGPGNDLMDGGAGADMLKGGAGNDVYVIDNAAEVITELVSEGTDVAKASVTYTIGANVEYLTLTGTAAINGTGNALNNVIVGNSAGNTLSGGAGADTMAGGTGNDTYVVDNASDVVTEGAGQGTDLVQSGINHVLAANVENLTLTGTGGINGTGNALNNTLTGNAGNNVLDGGAGTDIMVGGIGNDTYVVDVATDVVSEAVSAGTDNVNASVGYVLAANVENLTLTGTGAITATGNALANTLTGNAGNNILDGGVGTDVMRGGQGDDTYVVDAATDLVIENASEGADRIHSSISLTLAANVEFLTLTGAAAINGTGNTLNNWLQGNAVANALDGGSGNDALWGAAGDDALLGNAGNDLMQGGQGNDVLTDTAGSNLFDGGAGTDTLNGGSAREIFIGGAGVDTLTTGGGADVIAFNKGDGADVVNASVGTDDTLTLGGGLSYSNLNLKKTGLDLVLDAGSGDQITFRNWYQTWVNNKSVLNLQIVADSMAAFNAGGSDPMLNRRLATFDFAGLVGQFDAALLANPTLTNWNLASALASNYLSGSDTAAIGGDIAYDFGHRNALTNIGAVAAQTVLAGATFGVGAQTLQAAATLYSGTVRLQ
jgi:trimeric autotransporter adhesin